MTDPDELEYSWQHDSVTVGRENGSTGGSDGDAAQTHYRIKLVVDERCRRSQISMLL